ncbi:hypothetical protein ITG09_24375 (plasmid) [Vibrio cyclitrophicus]|nr:hypothetical protein [Vibrio cyclitrophicus]UPR55263.1 hypothetical protein ITG09_24375 [Vibrio cyclitrophicus]
MEQRRLEIATKVGVLSVPATNAIKEIPFLAVTMTQFGLFEVTHVPSGYRLVGDFERAVNAYVAMAEAQLALNELKVDSSLDGELFKSDLIAKDKECEILGMSFRQWMGLHAAIGGFSSEFPWEGDEDSPHSTLKNLMNKLKDKKVEQC